MKNNKDKKKWERFRQRFFGWPLLGVLLAAFLVGYLVRGGSPQAAGPAPHEVAEERGEDTAQHRMWTCSMHPQIKKPTPGDCPICGMALVPVAEEDSDDPGGYRRLKLSPAAVKLAEIRVEPVGRRRLTSNLRLVGKVEVDETRLKYISARVAGRIDRLYVDYTGTAVRRGDPLVKLYSPELVVAQQELLQARQVSRQAASGNSPRIRETLERTAAAAREKLRLWGFSPRQIEEIETAEEPSDHLTIASPIGGVVVHKQAVEGMYVQTGTRIYTVADLSRVWVQLDAYESDLAWLRPGQAVTFETEAYAGEVFTGRIAFIDPVVDPTTRTVKIRLEAANPHSRLKPEMFVRARVHASPAGSAGREAPLVIPATAPLLTGTRAVVYVAVAGRAGTYEGREVVLGPRAGNFYVVKGGLQEGEMVVVNGAFKIDSDLQIRAKPSMMNPQGGLSHSTSHHHGKTSPGLGEETDHRHGEEVTTRAVVSAYFALHQALSSDDFEAARKQVRRLFEILEGTDVELPEQPLFRVLKKNLREMDQAKEIDSMRTRFAGLSVTMTEVVQKFDPGIKKPIYRFHCPMALDNRGAYWLQDNPETRNPYFGASMLRCHDLKEKLAPGKEKE